MTLQEMIAKLDELTPQEMSALKEEVERRERVVHIGHGLAPDERARRLDAAFAQLREGLSDEEIDEIVDAMNEDYIEPWDETEWQD